MKIYEERSLFDFEFWSGAKDNAEELSYDEFEELEYILEDIYPEGMDATQLNDLFWFDFDWICEVLGKEVEE